MSHNNIDGHHHLPSWLSIAEVSLAPTKIIRVLTRMLQCLLLIKCLYLFHILLYYFQTNYLVHTLIILHLCYCLEMEKEVKKTYIRNKDSLKIVSTANLPNNQKLRTEDKWRLYIIITVAWSKGSDQIE